MASDISVISFRDHHHSYDPKQPDITWKQYTSKETLYEKLLQGAFLFTMVHYFLWVIVMFGAVGLLWIMGWKFLSVLLVLAYCTSFFDNAHLKTGRPWHAFRKSALWNYAQLYNGMEILREKQLDPSKQYIFGIYPHGILILSRVATYGGVFDTLFPGIETRVLGATPMFWIPGSREICLWMGAVDADKKIAEKILKKGLSLMIYPGGSSEIFATNPESKDTELVMRKGFIKLAIQSGSDLVPVFVFGEKWCYHRYYLPQSVQKIFMKTLRIPLIIFWGRGFTWLPRNDFPANLSMVFGTPIPVTKNAEPTDDDVNDLHAKYMTALTDIFERYKAKFGYSLDEKLVRKEVGRGE